MKLIINLKLNPTTEQAKSLKATLERCAKACDYISERGWKEKVFGQYHLSKLVYYDVRKKFDLTAQATVHCIKKVADAYKLDCDTQRFFKKHGAQPYDDRILSFKPNDIASIWAVDGRQKIPFVMGDYQRKLFANRKGETDLILVQGTFYLSTCCDFETPDLIEHTDIIGVDMGIVNLATLSTGKNFSGGKVEKNRKRLQTIKRALQKRGTKSAKRHLKKISDKEARFKKHENHCISKAIVLTAKGTNSAIAIEKLKGIGKRVTVRRAEREKHGKWAFAQLGGFIAYKAKKYGIPLTEIDPRNTSRKCSECGHISKKNRKTQANFLCVKCHINLNADYNAALNIRTKGLVTCPIAVLLQSLKSAPLGTAILLQAA